jgi:3-oxoacyl-[acyl-carrier-protein] synthase II
MTAPHPEGLGVARAIEEALNSSSRSTEDVGWIKAHGTGTRANDLAECRGLAKVFGDGLRDMPLTSLKSALGHSLGASGAVEMVATVIALEDGFVPATIGTEEVDPKLPPCSVTTSVQDAPEGSVLLLAESFGGRCGAMLVGRG